MSTKTRLGIDILATDKTARAFESVQRSMGGIKRNVEAMKFLMAGFVGGNMLEGMVRSFVEVSKQSAPVKSALDNLSGAWTRFAQRVGEGGLNQALIDFANRMNAMVSGTDGLAKSIGALLGGGINFMGRAFEVVGRMIAFAYDNAQLFGRLLAGMAVISFAQQIIRVAVGFYYLAKTVRETGIIMSAFQLISRANLLVFLALAAGVAYATDSLDQLKAGIDSMWAKVKEVFPMISQKVSGVMEGLGVDMSALSGNIADAITFIDSGKGAIGGIGKAASTAGDKIKDFGAAFNDAADDGGQAIAALTQSAKLLGDVGDTIGQSFRGLFDQILAGSMSVPQAFAQMAQSILAQISGLMLSSAIKAFIQLLNMGIAPSQQGGSFLESILNGIAGGRASGGPVMNGKTYLVGERGPELFTPGISGTIVPNLQQLSGRGSTGVAPVSVSINNYANSNVQTRQRPDGGIDIDILEKELASRVARGGSPLSQGLERGFGLRRAGRS